MALSPIGEAVLIAREGRRLKAYRDSKGIWTVGVGITSASGLLTVGPKTVLTSAECDLLSRRAFAQYAAEVDRALDGVVVEQHTYDALVSFCFNVGGPRFRSSTCLKRVRTGDLPGARGAMLWFNKPAEVISRRQGEADQLVTPYATRMPSARRGEAPIRASVPAGGTGAGAIVTPSLVIPPRRAAADVALPDWFLAFGRWLDALAARAARPAH